MKQLHSSQLQILKKLMYAQKLRYTDLKSDPEMENNLFDFHLDRLIIEGFVIKNEKLYFLTDSGKEYINHLDGKTATLITSPKIIVIIGCIKTDKTKKYLIQTRTKQPFYGQQGFVGGKVNFGEKIIDAAQRELKEETNLDGKPEVVALRHYIIKNKSSKKLLDDFYIYLCVCKNPQGKLIPNDEGTLAWVDESKLKTFVTNHIEGFASFMDQVNLVKNFRGQIILQEIDFESEKF